MSVPSSVTTRRPQENAIPMTTACEKTVRVSGIKSASP
jgi:hypothetical protein